MRERECSTCLNLNLCVNLLVTLVGCALARILSYTLSDAYQHAVGRLWGISVPARIHVATQTSFRHALGSDWCTCVPARIHLAIQTSLQMGVVGEEWDDEGARSSMKECSTSLNLEPSLMLLVILDICVLARILSFTPSDAG